MGTITYSGTAVSTTARAGMANLITRLRNMTQAGTADYALAGETYWGDAQLQDVLDAHMRFLERAPLRWLSDTNTGGTATYFRCATGWRDCEESGSGTIYWRIADSTGALQTTSGYTVNYVDGVVRFTADQGGTAYYLTGRSYDINAAAADVWDRKASYYAEQFAFGGDGQNFHPEQTFEHARLQAEYYRARTGQNYQRGELQFTPFMRTDIRPRYR